MCGIVGFFEPGGTDGDEASRIVESMAQALVHRGPDDSGIWVDGDAGVALGHRRLSIIDLSAEGRQPMSSADGRFVLVLNGEIYNYTALREELEQNDYRFRGSSDTEVALAAISRWGLRTALGRFIGMFAFALWDREERTLSLVRDRLGIKPLYYGWCRGMYMFGSELKALGKHPRFQCAIDRDALALFLRHSYIPAPYSIYEGIRKLPPASMITIIPGREPPAPTPYWNLKRVAEQGAAHPFRGSPDEAVLRLEELLKDAVRLHMEADVPLGAFLSGGVDSSTVVALMQAQSSNPVRTFTIGFREAEYNEAEWAREIARHLGTDHTELYLTAEDAISAIPKLPSLYDEPFADSSQIPTYLISELAGRNVKVSLSGDGGDESFYGYPRYRTGYDIWRRIHRVPAALRRSAASLLCALSGVLPSRDFRWLESSLKGCGRRTSVAGRARLLAQFLSYDPPGLLYHRLVSHWKDPSSVVIGGSEGTTLLTDQRQWANLPDFRRTMMYLDTMSYLPDDILVKVDRASMGVSLEVRVPLLDHRVVEFAWQIPIEMNIMDGKGKWLLRRVLEKYVPENLFDRPKTGFGIPIGEWLRGGLRDWAEELLSEPRLRREGFFAPEPVRLKWEEHVSGEQNWQYYLWDILMFQAWHQAHQA